MRDAITTILLAFVTQAYVKDGTNNMVDKLFDRVLKAWPIHSTHLENTMLEKSPSSLAQPSRPVVLPLAPRSQLVPSLKRAQHGARSSSVSSGWLPHVSRSFGSSIPKLDSRLGFGLEIPQLDIGLRTLPRSRSIEVRSKKIDPDDGNAYTFDEIRSHYSRYYSEAEIKAYWDNDCKPERKIDPDDGQAYTFDDILTYYRGKYSENEIKAYWDHECKPASQQAPGFVQNVQSIEAERKAREEAARQKAEAERKAAEEAARQAQIEAQRKAAEEAARLKASTEKKIDPDDGNAYTFDEIRRYYSGKYPENEIKAYWDNDCKPVMQQAKTLSTPSPALRPSPSPALQPSPAYAQSSRSVNPPSPAPPGMESGTLVDWKEDRGFGFIRPSGGRVVGQLFVHVKNLVDGEGSVQRGDRVFFIKRVNDARGKTEATEVQLDSAGSTGPPPEENPWDAQEQEEVTYEGESTVIDFDAYDNIPVETKGSGVPPFISTFDEVQLPDGLLANVKRCKFTKPTPVQKYAIPIALAKRDLMACAQTGSGKTVGFMFPTIVDILRSGAQTPPSGRTAFPRALVLAPTRELAIQIHEETRKFIYQTGLRAVVLYGGAPIGAQIRNMMDGCDIVVATPGRLNDLIDRGRISMEKVEYLTLDEADRMLDMGFEPQIREIVEYKGMKRRGERLTLMFSATFPKEIQNLASDFMSNYIFLTVGRVGSTSDLIEQRVEEVDQYDKRGNLLELCRGPSGLKLVFVETKRDANTLETFLRINSVPATSIHGDRSQQEREYALSSFKKGETPVLVATAVAARGLDIPHVTLVVNYDMPNNIDDYVHRIGRTGRAGKKGIATTFFSAERDSNMAKDLVEVLEEAKQNVPEFLYSIAATSGRGKKKGGSNVGGRRQQSGWKPVPLGGGGRRY